MMNALFCAAGVCVVALIGAAGSAFGSAEPAATVSAQVLGYTVKDISGADVDLKQYTGKVVLLVNGASKCGLTEQYKALEQLYRDKKDQGFVIVCFPANNFMGQEPGSNDEIAAFCKGEYDVTFPMMAKISVKGEDQHPLYAQLAAQPAPIGGDPTWNFTKFVVDRSGKVVARFDPRVTPDSPEVMAKIDALLAEKP